MYRDLFIVTFKTMLFVQLAQLSLNFFEHDREIFRLSIRLIKNIPYVHPVSRLALRILISGKACHLLKVLLLCIRNEIHVSVFWVTHANGDGLCRINLAQTLCTIILIAHFLIRFVLICWSLDGAKFRVN